MAYRHINYHLVRQNLVTVPKTPIELEMERASKAPGPGAYKIKKLEIHGGVISKSEIPSDADLIAKRAKYQVQHDMQIISYVPLRKILVVDFPMQNY